MMGLTAKAQRREEHEGSLRSLRHCVFAVIFFAFTCFFNPIFSQPPVFRPKTNIVFQRLGNKTIPIQIIEFGEPNGIVCINLHDDEFTSVTAAMSILKETGGTLIKIQNKRERLITFRLKNNNYVFDPNRIFSPSGIRETLRKNKTQSEAAIEAIDRFSHKLLLLIPDSAQCIIALHNNTPGYYGIKSYLPGGNFEKDAKEVFRDKKQDEDDIFFTTDSLIYKKMAEAGYNSIWQDNENATRDGSLSVYYGELNRSYVNIETEHGKIDQYRKMLRALLLCIRTVSRL